MFVVRFGDFDLSKPFKTRLEAEEWLSEWRRIREYFPNAGKLALDPKTYGQPEGSILHVVEVVLN